MAMSKQFKKLPKAAKRAAFAQMDADKTMVTTTNRKTIVAGLKNPAGMVMKNTPKVRKAVASEVHSILRKLQGKK